MSSTKSDDKTSTSKAGNNPTPAQQSEEPEFGKQLLATTWLVILPFLIISLSGVFADGLLETDPIFSLVALFVAIAVVSTLVYRYLQRHFPETAAMLRGEKDSDVEVDK